MNVMSSDDKDKPNTTDGIMSTLRANAKKLGLEKEFDANPQAVIDAMFANREPASINTARVDPDYYRDLANINHEIEAFKERDLKGFLETGSSNLRAFAYMTHFNRHALATKGEMDDPTYGFNQLVVFNLALQEIIDIFPRAESGQIIASLYHVTAFITVSTLCTHRNVPIPLRGINQVLEMNLSTTSRTLNVLSDFPFMDDKRRIALGKELKEASEKVAKSKSPELHDLRQRIAVIQSQLEAKSVSASVEVEGVKADGSIGKVGVNTRIIGENRLGLITRLEEYNAGTTKGNHIKLTEKGLMLASRIKDILNAKAEWAGKQSN